MVQFRKTEPGRRRRIKRDVVDADKKGVAGLRLQSMGNSQMLPAASVDHSTSASASEQATSRGGHRQTSDSADVTGVLGVDRLVIGSSSDDE